MVPRCPTILKVLRFDCNHLFFFSSIDFAGNGYLKKMEEDPAAVVLLGDSAYDRSKNKDTLGIGRPVPLAKDGVQQKVKEQG